MVASIRAGRCARRHRLRRHGGGRLRVRRERPLPRRGVQRHRRAGPRRHRGAHRDLVLRCLVSPFAHPLFTAFTGIGVGVAASSRSAAVRFFAPVLGYCAAVAAHAV
ncbi:MAG: PrsW family glutamic-type intramembrane protease [Nocardioides sp.]